jgi:hypothetical protein
MTIQCTGYVISAAGAWAKKGDGSAALKSESHLHAERVAWGKLPTSTAYLLVQNAFPCTDCHIYFKGESKNHNIVIKVEANDGAYSAEHFKNAKGLPILKGATPCVIYYRNEVATYVNASIVMGGGSGDPPAGFPAIPEIL